MKIGLISLVNDLLGLLQKQERKRLITLGLLMVLLGILQVFSVISILPFVTVVTNYELAEKTRYIRFIRDLFVFNKQEFILFFGIVTLALVVISNLASAYVIWYKQNFTNKLNHRITTSLFRGYLSRDYDFFLQRNSADLNKNLLNEVNGITDGLITPMLDVLANITTTLLILLAVLIANPVSSLFLLIGLGGSYGLILLLIRKRTSMYGRKRIDANENKYKTSSEAFGGIKEIKVRGTEEFFLGRFDKAAEQFHKYNNYFRLTSLLPPKIVEIIIFGGIVTIVLLLTSGGEPSEDYFPLIAFYAFSAYRIKPSVQTIFASLTTIEYYRSVLQVFKEDVPYLKDKPEEGPEERLPLLLEKELVFKDVGFRYSNREEALFQNLSLQITAYQTIGVAGFSGSGKTTFVDLLMGLLKPVMGQIQVDGTGIDHHNLKRWQKSIGYVPQSIFLADDTIARNIAFGTEVDLERVTAAAKAAKIHEFIMTMPDGYESKIGERGVRISGGERQRLGIARALYQNPSVLILDEATSALDGVTEDFVMDSIASLLGKKTIIIIAHRLTTLKFCDRIFIFEGGRVADTGTFDELLVRNSNFQLMAKLTEQ